MEHKTPKEHLLWEYEYQILVNSVEIDMTRRDVLHIKTELLKDLDKHQKKRLNDQLDACDRLIGEYVRNNGFIKEKIELLKSHE